VPRPWRYFCSTGLICFTTSASFFASSSQNFRKSGGVEIAHGSLDLGHRALEIRILHCLPHGFPAVSAGSRAEFPEGTIRPDQMKYSA